MKKTDLDVWEILLGVTSDQVTLVFWTPLLMQSPKSLPGRFPVFGPSDPSDLTLQLCPSHSLLWDLMGPLQVLCPQKRCLWFSAIPPGSPPAGLALVQPLLGRPPGPSSLTSPLLSLLLVSSLPSPTNRMKWRRSVLSDSVTPWTVAHRAPLSREFSRQEYWSGSPCSPPEDLPNPGIESRSPALQADALPSEPPGKPDQWQDVSYSLASVFSVPPSPWVSSQMFLLDRYLWLKEYVTKRMAPEALSPWSHSQHALPMWTQRDDWWQPQGKQRWHRGWTAFGSTQHTLTSPLLWVRSWVRG